MTTPLPPIVAFLRRHKRGLECLEGATTFQELDEEIGPIFNAVHMWCIDGDIDLWLGRSEICPAALGWAAEVLAVGQESCDDEVWYARLFVGDTQMWLNGSDSALWRWSWSEAADASRRDKRHKETILRGPTPPTPAARLAAVLKYEVER